MRIAFAIVAILATMSSARALDANERCVEVDFSLADDALSDKCRSSSKACIEGGCVEAMFAWANASATEDGMKALREASRETVLKCLIDDIEEYARYIPLNTLVAMNACDYAPYLDAYPHLRGFDLSMFTARDFIAALAPGQIQRLLAIQREQRLTRP